MRARFHAALLAMFLVAGVRVDAAESVRCVETGRRLGAGVIREVLALDVDERGFVFAADAMTGKIFRFDTTGAVVEFEQPAGSAVYPIDLAAFGPFVYVLDYDAGRVLRFDYKGAWLDVLLSFDADRHRPVSFDEGGGGRFVSTDIETHEIVVRSPLLDVELSFGEYGWVPGRFNRPLGAVLQDDGRIVVLDAGNERLQFFSPAGGYERIATPAEREFVSPRSISVGPADFLCVSDPGAGAVFFFDAGGEPLGSVERWDGKPIEPAAAVIGRDGILFVSDLASRSILLYRLDRDR